MNRRTFLRSAGSIAAISPVVLMSKLADIGRQKREPMQPMKTGQVLTASYLNEITDRINELEQRL